jgi:hypothetical protein
MTELDWTVLALVILPLVAVISLGFVVRALLDAGGNVWPLCLLILVLACVAWAYVYSVTL